MFYDLFGILRALGQFLAFSFASELPMCENVYSGQTAVCRPAKDYG